MNAKHWIDNMLDHKSFEKILMRLLVILSMSLVLVVMKIVIMVNGQ